MAWVEVRRLTELCCSTPGWPGCFCNINVFSTQSEAKPAILITTQQLYWKTAGKITTMIRYLKKINYSCSVYACSCMRGTNRWRVLHFLTKYSITIWSFIMMYYSNFEIILHKFFPSAVSNVHLLCVSMQLWCCCCRSICLSMKWMCFNAPCSQKN
jgi:hypothetical protein